MIKRKIICTFCLVLVSFLLLGGCDKNTGNGAYQALSESEITEFIAQHFNRNTSLNIYDQVIQIEMLTGEIESLSDNQGKFLVLNFWATWCYPCKVEMPDLESLDKRMDKDSFRLLTINVAEPKEKVGKFIKKEKYTFDIGLDSNRRISERFGISALPTTILVDKNGNILGHVMGTKPWNSDEFVSFFRSISNQ